MNTSGHKLTITGKGHGLYGCCTCQPERGGVWCWTGRYVLETGRALRALIKADWDRHVAWEIANPGAWD